jgi:hypothetical protein
MAQKGGFRSFGYPWPDGDLAPKLDISVTGVVLPLSTHRGIDTHL